MMGVTLKIVVLLCATVSCNGLTATEFIQRVGDNFQEDFNRPLLDTRKRFSLDGESAVIIGAPSYPSHLPKAEPILPGHTLIRPALGMLKSALKFPHREFENGAGVYGNLDKLGIKYGGKNERLRYSGFRRSNLADLLLASQEQTKEELQRLQKREHKKPQTKSIPRLLTIFLARPLEKISPKWPIFKDNLILGDLILWSTTLHDRPNRNIKRTMNSRLHSSLKTYTYMKKLMKKLRGNRRQHGIIVVKPIESGDLGYNVAPDTKPEISNEISTEEDKKVKNLIVKDVYNHKIYRADAPDFEDFLPIDSTDIKKDISRWWYYHQDGYKSFVE